jgi:uncharacterized membrane protein YbhN (UPF0104 family)
MTKQRWMLVVRLVAICVIGVGLWFFVRHMDFEKLGTALSSATVWPLLLAALLNFGCLFGKALCWRIMFTPRYHVPLMRLYRYTIAAFAASAIAPARAGEVLRIWALKKRDGIPAADSSAVAVAEKLLDGMTMLLLVAPVPWLVPGLPSWVSGWIALCAGIAVVLFIAFYIAVGRVRADDGSSALRRFIAGMHVVRSPKRLLGAGAALVFTWLCDLSQVLLVLHALGIHVPLAAGLLILFTLNLTIAVPSTPAQVGALEVGALAALDILHVPGELALAFALLYHALQVVPLIIVGLTLELRLVLGREQIASDAESAVT